MLIDAWSEGHRELAIALDDLEDKDVWVRPHPRLLSIGELVGHITYYEAIRTSASEPISQDQPDLSKVRIKSVLIDPRFRYYSPNVEELVTLDIGAKQLAAEVKRVHEEAKTEVLKLDPDYKDPMASLVGWTWGYHLQYRSFHVAYHCGQIYSVRHLLGHTPEDN
jgi:hypothetical protein